MMGSSRPKCTLSSEYVYCGTVGGDGSSSEISVWVESSPPAVWRSFNVSHYTDCQHQYTSDTHGQSDN